MSSICLMTFLFSRAFITPVHNIIYILSIIYNDIYVISGSHMEVAEMMKSTALSPRVEMRIVCHKKAKCYIERILMYILLQMKMSIELIKLPKDTSNVLFFMQVGVLLPMLTAKLLGKRILWLLPSSHNKMIKHGYTDPATLLLSYLQTIGYHLANGLILYSPNLTQEWKLEKYRHKIYIAAEHIIDIEAFSLVKGLDQRPNLVGYIGRLSEEKGIYCLIKAIPQIVEVKPEMEFFIGGDGILYDKIRSSILNSDLCGKTTMIGWIPHESLSHYLNELRLLIIPSYTEGLPNLMLEAMACGTPVLATPVGAIPDIIKDSDTGFLMPDNSPECIAANVIRAIEYPDLKGIAQRARALVVSEFTFDKAVGRWEKILE